MVTKSNLNPVVIKLGGEAVLKPKVLESLTESLCKLRSQYDFVFVHGGGPQIEAALSMAQFATEKINGQRQTHPRELSLVIGALAGFANQQFVTQLNQHDWFACGMSLSDAGGVPLSQENTSIQVGVPEWPQLVEAPLEYRRLLQVQLEAGFTPVISSIGCTANGKALNVNADFAAAAVAILLQAPLFLLSNVAGVLNETGNLLTHIHVNDVSTVLQREYVTDGMHVKLEAARASTFYTRRNSAITSWQEPELVIAAIQHGNAGTQITF